MPYAEKDGVPVLVFGYGDIGIVPASSQSGHIDAIKLGILPERLAVGASGYPAAQDTKVILWFHDVEALDVLVKVLGIVREKMLASPLRRELTEIALAGDVAAEVTP